MNPDFRRNAHRWRASRASVASLIACGLVLLQLVTALHFALVPHGFSAGLNGFVHVHAAPGESPQRVDNARALPGLPSLISGAASCAPESCPIGFSGPHSLLLSPAPATRLLELAVLTQSAPPAPVSIARSVLLRAPKTSPSIRV
jgi:hypothetical protein